MNIIVCGVYGSFSTHVTHMRKLGYYSVNPARGGQQYHLNVLRLWRNPDGILLFRMYSPAVVATTC